MLDKLEREREKIKNLKAPDDFEDRLYKSLEGKKFRRRIWTKVASFIVVSILILGYNSNNIAGFVRNIGLSRAGVMSNYEELSNEKTLEAMKSEYFQEIDREILLKDGNKFSFDGILVSEEGFNIFYSVDRDMDFYFLRFKNGSKEGPLVSSTASGYGDIVYNNSFVDMNLKDEKLTIEIKDERQNLVGQLDIYLDLNKTIKNTERIKVKEKFRANGTSYTIDYVTINPMAIRVEGHHENILQFMTRYFYYGEKNENLVVKLEINGEEYLYSLASFTTDLSGSHFEFRFENFNKDIRSLKLIGMDKDYKEIGEIVIK